MAQHDPIHRRSIRVRLADLPGSLHQLTSLVTEADVNIVRLEVVSREQPEVWDDIEMTAATSDQLDFVVHALKEHGLTVVGLPPSWSIRDWAVDVLRALEQLGAANDAVSAMDQFAATAAALANVAHGFVLMEPAHPDAMAAEARWNRIQKAAELFDPDTIKWSGDAMGSRIVVSAMRAARHQDGIVTAPGRGIGAVIRIPISTKRPARLVVVGQRPPFLAPELSRLELFAQVAAPHLLAYQRQATA